MVHASAGTALTADGPLGVGDVVRATDHINLSGTSPLTGLGESRLGPLFPDQTRVHDAELGRLADEAARAGDVTLGTAVVACTVGPALSTPAEHAWFAGAGADVAVQRLAGPLVAAAHAGVATVAFVAVADVAGERGVDVAELVARAARTAPTLDGLVLRTIERLAPLARERAEEERP
jgi:purine-nucleoside phosphorylase